MTQHLLFICGNPGSGKTTISKHLVKHYLKDFYFLDKDTMYVKLSGELMSIVNDDRYDRDSPAYKKHCRDFEYRGMLDCAKENAQIGKNTLLCAPFGKELSSLENFHLFKNEVSSFATPHFIWLEATSEKIKSNILQRGHSFDKYKLEHWDEYMSARKNLPSALENFVSLIYNEHSNLDKICQQITSLIPSH